MRSLTVGAMLVALGAGLPAAAQDGPQALGPDANVQGRLTASSPRLPDGGAYDCYAIETTPGQQVTVTMRSQAFDSRLWIARGGQCATARLQEDNDDALGRDAQVSFTAGGGRYLILARTKAADGAGPYRLTLEGGAPMQTATVAAPRGEDERVALMNRQVAQREARLAAEAAARRAAEAQRQLEEMERRERERQERQESQARNAAIFNTFVNTLGSELANYQQQQNEQQAFLNDLNRQARAVARQREEAEQRQREAEQAARQAEQRQGHEALARQLAEANAYRERQIAQTTNPAERQRLAAQSAGALQAARQIGMEDQVRGQTQAILAGRQSSAMVDQQTAQQQRREQAEADRRAAEQRQIQQAEQRRVEEQRRLEEQRRQADEQRQIQLAEQRRQEQARQAAAERAEAERRRAAANAPAVYASAPAVGRLTRDWSQWYTHATHNGVTISWRARIYDSDSLRIQWKCDNRSGERRYCSIGDKSYRCYAGNAPAGQGGGMGEASDVGVGREYTFIGETACNGSNLTFVLPQARATAVPTT